MGYRPHPVARMLSAGQTTTIGILSPQALGQVFANPFFALFAEGVASVTEEHGFGLLFISPLHGSLARALDRATVDGIVVVGLDERHPEMESIRRAGLPAVLVDAPAWPEHGAVGGRRRGRCPRWPPSISCGLGHRAFLVISVEPPSMASRLDDERGGSPAAWLPQRPSRPRAWSCARSGCVVVGPATFEGGESAFLRAWEDGAAPHRPCCAMSDAAAAGVLQAAARHLGLRVPDDLSHRRVRRPAAHPFHGPAAHHGAPAGAPQGRGGGDDAARGARGDRAASRRTATGSWRRAWWSAAPRRHPRATGVRRWSLPTEHGPVSNRSTRASHRAARRGGGPDQIMNRTSKLAGLLAAAALVTGVAPVAAQTPLSGELTLWHSYGSGAGTEPDALDRRPRQRAGRQPRPDGQRPAAVASATSSTTGLSTSPRAPAPT